MEEVDDGGIFLFSFFDRGLNELLKDIEYDNLNCFDRLIEISSSIFKNLSKSYYL